MDQRPTHTVNQNQIETPQLNLPWLYKNLKSPLVLKWKHKPFKDDKIDCLEYKFPWKVTTCSFLLYKQLSAWSIKVNPSVNT